MSGKIADAAASQSAHCESARAKAGRGPESHDRRFSKLNQPYDEEALIRYRDPYGPPIGVRLNLT
jgi:hypothetical protein